MCARGGDDTEAILLDEPVNHLCYCSAIARVACQTNEDSLPCIAWFMTLSCRYAITKPQRAKSVAVTPKAIASELSMDTVWNQRFLQGAFKIIPVVLRRRHTSVSLWAAHKTSPSLTGPGSACWNWISTVFDLRECLPKVAKSFSYQGKAPWVVKIFWLNVLIFYEYAKKNMKKLPRMSSLIVCSDQAVRFEE